MEGSARIRRPATGPATPARRLGGRDCAGAHGTMRAAKDDEAKDQALMRMRGQDDPRAASEAAPRLLSLRWDAEYRRGRYAGEPPIQFAGTVVSILQQHPSILERGGLYVGCGNGRNYLPLVDLGLDLLGLDVSPEAIRRLAERRPAQTLRLICEDFRC